MITIQLNKKLLNYTLLPYDDCGNVIESFKNAYAVGMEPVTKPFLNKDFEENSDYEIPVAEYYAENSKTPIATVSIEGLYEFSENGKADMLIANVYQDIKSNIKQVFPSSKIEILDYLDTINKQKFDRDYVRLQITGLGKVLEYIEYDSEYHTVNKEKFKFFLQYAADIMDSESEIVEYCDY